MEETKDKVKTSIGIAARLINGLKNLCQGVHIMAIGWEKKIPMVLEETKL
jgi:methylenetetrahydrofolate reductase (NADPH)